MQSICRAVCLSAISFVLAAGHAHAQITEEDSSSYCASLGFAAATKGSSFITLGTSRLRPGLGFTGELVTSSSFDREIFSFDGVYNIPLSQKSMIHGVAGVGFCFGYDLQDDDTIFGLSLSAGVQMRTGRTVIGARWKSYHSRQAIGLTLGMAF